MKYLKKLLLNYKILSVSSVGPKCYVSTGQTVIDAEVEKFNEMSGKWWDTEGPMKLLHGLNNWRVPFIRDSIIYNHTQPATGEKAVDQNGPFPLKGYKLIDVGCGAGILSEALAKIGADVTGLDAAEQLLAVARQHASLNRSLSENLQYVNSMVEDHTVENRSKYDAVICSEVLEHVNDPGYFVEQCVKLVKPGGSLVFTTINRTPIAGFIAIFLAENVLRVIPKETHHYNMLIPTEDLEKMLKKNNCDIRRTQGTLACPNGQWINIPTNAIFYAMHAVKNI